MRIRNTLSGLAVLIGASLLASCTGGGSTIPAPQLTTTTVTATDPTGDTNAAIAGTPYDITGATASRLISGPTTLNVTLSFVQPVLLSAAPGGADPTQLTGLIWFNIADTGGITTPAFCGPATAYPHVSYYIVMTPRLADGNYNVKNAVTAAITGEAVPTLNGNTVSLAVPISAIGGTIGTTKFAASLGNGTNATDCVPNTGMIGPI